MLIRSDRHNRRRLAEALTDLGAVSDHPIDADDFVGNTQWKTDAGDVDVLVTATGPDETILMYADIEPGALIIEIASGRLVPTASLDDITQTAARENPTAAGDMAADLFGMDIGL